jgi:starch synthase (maltosyl-transferring)
MASRARPSAPTRAVPSRIVIERVTPCVDDGRWPAKRVVGEPVSVGALVLADGHDRIYCAVAHQPPGQRGWTLEPMVSTNPGLDEWQAELVPAAVGGHRFRVVAWIDELATWIDGTIRKLEDDQDVSGERQAGAALLDELAAAAPKPDIPILIDAADQLRAGKTGWLTAPSAVLDASHRSLRLGEARKSKPTLEIAVVAERVLFNTWYELFPRSWSTRGDGVHGTFADVEAQLSYVADMGFDVLYLPPVHPIGTSFRKGADNATVAGPADPGSPWAIGDGTGGHTAIHAELGTRADFVHLVRAARAEGIEVALDIAFQCSPDHPWVTEHPEWFRHRPDGSIQYAENPPKKYQDIYPFDFEGRAWEALWEALLDVFLHWARLGVTIFRVDNPHTKPFAFWEWVIAEVRTRYPDAMFLAEAFTRPAVMHRLAMIGFDLSYSYFPWRQSRQELVDYFTELTSPPGSDYFRPSCWPNTPDILTEQLWGAPSEAFALRYFLAATLSPSIGIYGPAFELGDNHDAGNGKEEYARSEKYQLRAWDLHDPASGRETIAEINRHRFGQRALHTLRTLRFHGVDNGSLIAYSKTTHDGPCTDPALPSAQSVLVVANLDPCWTQGGFVDLDLAALGIDPDRGYRLHDLLADRTFEWVGPRNYVELDPADQPGHLFRVEQDPAG